MASDRTPIASFGAILLAAGGILFYMDWITRSDTIITEATIVSFKETIAIDSVGVETRTTRPFIWFVTQHGDTIQSTTSNEKGYQVGQVIELRYKKDNPNKFYNVKSLFWPILFASVAILGIYVIYLSTKTKEWD